MPKEIYQYSDSVLKHLPEKSPEKVRKHFLYSKKPAVYLVGLDRRAHNNDNNRMDDNLEDRIANFETQIQNKFVYRILFQYLCDLGKTICLTKIGMKIRRTLETDMKKLSE